MAILILGVIAFFGLHSLRVIAETWRVRQVAALGEARWKTLYSVVSIAALALMLWGFSLARADAPVVWTPPKPLHYLTALLVLGLVRAGGRCLYSGHTDQGRHRPPDDARGQDLGLRAPAFGRHAGRHRAVRIVSGLGRRGLCGRSTA